MTGIAAILKYSLPELEDIEEDEEKSSDDESQSDQQSEASSIKGFDDEQIEKLLEGELMEGDDESEMSHGSVDEDDD
jgi:hypothetical protein